MEYTPSEKNNVILGVGDIRRIQSMYQRRLCNWHMVPKYGVGLHRIRREGLAVQRGHFIIQVGAVVFRSFIRIVHYMSHREL